MKTPLNTTKTNIKRTGRSRDIGELVSKLIDPVLKKRGFASRDILENWQIIAPPPYNSTTIPDRLKWPRNKAASHGAILYLRCMEGERVALSHDHERITEAINRYFGYVLVRAIKLSNQPFVEQNNSKTSKDRQCAAKINQDPRTDQKIEKAVQKIKDDELKQALRELGHGIFSKNNK